MMHLRMVNHHTSCVLWLKVVRLLLARWLLHVVLGLLAARWRLVLGMQAAIRYKLTVHAGNNVVLPGCERGCWLTEQQWSTACADQARAESVYKAPCAVLLLSDDFMGCFLNYVN